MFRYDDSAAKFPLSPKAVLAFELDGQADGGQQGRRISSSASGRRIKLGKSPAAVDSGRSA